MTLRPPKAELPAELKESTIEQLGVVPENVEVLWHSSGSGGRAAVSLVSENGRITRICATSNPHKLARLDAPAALTR